MQYFGRNPFVMTILQTATTCKPMIRGELRAGNRGEGGTQQNNRINPLAGISAAINRCGSPTTTPAASRPLRPAPSIVEGHSVAVQSPARKNPGHPVACPGRNSSSPGTTENV